MSTAPTTSKAVKPGHHTTEFAMTAVAELVLSLNTFHVWTFVHPPWVSLIVQGAVLGAYSLSRGWAKS